MPEQPPDFDPERTPEELYERLHRIADRLGELVTPENIDTAALAPGTEVSYHYGYIKNAEGEIEYTKPLPSVRRSNKATPEEEAFVPATPAKITPSRRKPVERDHDLLFLWTDLQYGERDLYDHRTKEHSTITSHDEAAMSIIRMMCRDLQPELIINLGDTIDLSSISRWKRSSNHFMNELGDSFQGVHNFYAQLRSDNPTARMIEVTSNHNQRLDDFIHANFPQIWNVYRPGSDDKYPVASYPNLANLDHVGVEWVGGYPAGEYVHGAEYDAPPIVFRHGTETGQNGVIVTKIAKNHPETHNVQGHGHTIAEAWHTRRDGRMLGNFAVGAACRTTGEVDSYHSAVNEQNQPVHHQENWQQGVMVIRDYRNGEYEFVQIPINNGRAFYSGKEYQA